MRHLATHSSVLSRLASSRLRRAPGTGGLRYLLTFLAAQLDPASAPLADAIALTQAEQLHGRTGIGLGWLRSTKPPGLESPFERVSPR